MRCRWRYSAQNCGLQATVAQIAHEACIGPSEGEAQDRRGLYDLAVDHYQSGADASIGRAYLDEHRATLKSAYQQHAAVTAETPFASWVVADMAKQAAAAFTDDGEEQEHICEPSMCDHRAGPRQGWELTRSGPGSTSI